MIKVNEASQKLVFFRGLEMITNAREGWHEFYMKNPRHWCPRSEPYTGADSLLTALDQGWQVINNAVYREVVMFNHRRRTTIFYFRLYKDGHTRTMAVIRNPFVVHMVRKQNYHVRSYQDYTSIELETVTALVVKAEAATV